MNVVRIKISVVSVLLFSAGMTLTMQANEQFWKECLALQPLSDQNRAVLHRKLHELENPQEHELVNRRPSIAATTTALVICRLLLADLSTKPNNTLTVDQRAQFSTVLASLKCHYRLLWDEPNAKPKAKERLVGLIDYESEDEAFLSMDGSDAEAIYQSAKRKYDPLDANKKVIEQLRIQNDILQAEQPDPESEKGKMLAGITQELAMREFINRLIKKERWACKEHLLVLLRVVNSELKALEGDASRTAVIPGLLANKKDIEQKLARINQPHVPVFKRWYKSDWGVVPATCERAKDLPVLLLTLPPAVQEVQQENKQEDQKPQVETAPKAPIYQTFFDAALFSAFLNF